MHFRERLNSEHVLYIVECRLLEHLRRPHSFILEEVFGAEAHRDAVPALHSHIFPLFPHELISSPLLTSLGLRWTFAVQFLTNRVRPQISCAYRSILANTDEMATAFLTCLVSPLIRKVDHRD